MSPAAPLTINCSPSGSPLIQHPLIDHEKVCGEVFPVHQQPPLTLRPLSCCTVILLMTEDMPTTNSSPDLESTAHNNNTSTNTSKVNSHSPDDGKPKKRLRMSVVCLNCKARKIKCDKKRPSCTNCLRCNVGHLCEYEPPHWVSRVTSSTGLHIVDLKEAEKVAISLLQQQQQNQNQQQQQQKQQTQELYNALSADPSPNAGSCVSTGVSVDVDVKSTHDEINRLRARLLALEQSVGMSQSASVTAASSSSTTLPINPHDDDNQDAVDFYESYYSLVVKRSGMEEHKPLSSMAHPRKDQYFMIMTGYFNLCGTLYKARYGDLRRRAGNKKTRLDASLTEFLYLLGEKESPEVVQVVSRFIKERIPKNHTKINNFPSTTEIKDSDALDAVKKAVEKLLPTKRILRLYMARFYKYLYPYFPYVDKKFLDDRMFNNVLSSPDDDSAISIVIEEKSDFIILSMFLIIVRLAYLALPLPSQLPEDEKILINAPIGPQFISTAMSALSLFKIMRKTKLTIIQALLYFRVYCSVAPEDGDGAELSQSQIIFATIVQSAYTIGLNRDASRHKQMNYDKDYADLWRRIWIGILDVDRFYSTIAGHIPIIQNVNSYELNFPEPRDTDTPVDKAMSEEAKKSQRMLKLYFDMANMVSNFTNTPRVSQLIDLIRQMNVYLGINYNCNEMKPLSTAATLDERASFNFSNVKRLRHTFQTKALSLSVYQVLCSHYESPKTQNFVKLREYLVHMLKTTVELANLLYKLLTNGFSDYIDENHKFYLHRYSENMIQRVMNSFISILTRLYHSTDLINRGIGSESLIPSIQETTNYVFRVSSAFNILMQNTLGTTHYQAFKTSLKYKFYLRSLRKDGYKCIRDTINFVNEKFPGDPVARISLLQRLDLKTSPQTVLQELDTMNYFVNCSIVDIETWKTMILQCSILDDAVLSSENVIWEPSFKTLPMDDLYGMDSTKSMPETAVATPHSGGFMGGLAVDDLINNDMMGSGIINLEEMMNIDNGIYGGYDELFKEPGPSADWLFRM